MENLISFMYDLLDSLKLSSDTLFEVVNVHAAVEMTQETDEDERWMTEEDNIPLSKLMQGEDEDDTPLSHFRQNKNEDDFPLSQFRQSEDKDNIPLSHLQRGTESSFVESCLHMDDNLNNISHATLDQGLSLECSESEFLSDHLSDGDEYVPSKAEIRSQKYSSSEVSCDENDETLRENPTERFSTEYQPETTYLDHAITEQTGCNVSDECLNESVANNTSTGQTSAGGSQPTSPCPFPIQDKPRQTRKRVRNEDDWKINVRKRLRNRGQSYVSRTGKTHRNRVLKSGCGDLCRKKCKTQITEDERAQIFHNFWKMGCLTQQRKYLCNTVQKNEEKKLQ